MPPLAQGYLLPDDTEQCAPPCADLPWCHPEVLALGDSAIDPTVATWGICEHCLVQKPPVISVAATRSSAEKSMSQLVIACVLW